MKNQFFFASNEYFILVNLVLILLHSLANDWIKNYGTFTQWNSMQQRERRSLYPLQQHGWNWRALC